MTTTHLTTSEDFEAPELGEIPLEDWAPVILDPVRERLVQLGGERIAEALAEAAPSPFPPLSTTYGRFSRICGESDEALVAWFQPVGDVPAVRLVVPDPFASGWAMTEEVAVPSLRRHLVVLAPLSAESAWPRAHARLVAICRTPVEDFGLGAELATIDAIGAGRLAVPGPLVEL